MPSAETTGRMVAGPIDILNAIRNSATANYRDYVPVANMDLDSIREIGAIIMNFPALQNEFLTALVNRIGRVILNNKMYSNPWAMFKRGMLDFGETIEEVFVDLAKPFEFDPAVAESQVFKRQIPDVQSAFHIMNYQKYYKTTVSRDQLRQAFLSWDGITNLITKIIDSMYSASNYDEFQVMKYMLAYHLLHGELYPAQVSAVSAANAKAIISTVKGMSNAMTFMTDQYNLAGVHNFTLKEDQYIIVNSAFDALMDVEVLASAFNMDKAEFMGHRVLIDGFGAIDTTRLAQLFYGNDTYHTFTDSEKAALNAIPAVIVDKDYFMILDNLNEFTEQYNGEGLYWNYWYHAWKTFSVSPFAQAIAFIPGTPSITSVDVSPATATLAPGAVLNATATVVTANFAPETVNWTTSDATKATVDIYGTITVNPDLDADTSVTITATSAFDSTKTDTCVITVDV